MFFFIIIPPFCNILVSSSSKNQIYSDVSEVPYNKIGLLLGTSKKMVNGKTSLYFSNRIDAAVLLFNSKKIDKILISADNSTEYYKEADDIKSALLKRGIPEENIVVDNFGLRTLDSVVRANKIFGLEKFTIISQNFHNQRAVYLANKKNLDVVAFNAKSVEIGNVQRMKNREKLARVKAVLDIIFHKKPKYLGDKISID